MSAGLQLLPPKYWSSSRSGPACVGQGPYFVYCFLDLDRRALVQHTHTHTPYMSRITKKPANVSKKVLKERVRFVLTLPSHVLDRKSLCSCEADRVTGGGLDVPPVWALLSRAQQPARFGTAPAPVVIHHFYRIDSGLSPAWLGVNLAWFLF